MGVVGDPKHSVVTGASGGIGKAIARALAAAGHDVAIIGRDLADATADALCAKCAELAGAR